MFFSEPYLTMVQHKSSEYKKLVQELPLYGVML